MLTWPFSLQLVDITTGHQSLFRLPPDFGEITTDCLRGFWNAEWASTFGVSSAADVTALPKERR